MGYILVAMPDRDAKTILIVDDNRDAADSLAMLIRNEGYRALIAYDSQTGLELANESSPDIIFHDIGLPNIDGYMAARQLRSDAKFAKTILVALTAYDSTPDRKRASMAGFNLHMSKPMDFEALKLVLNRVRNS